jgi:hypothetical protein
MGGRITIVENVCLYIRVCMDVHVYVCVCMCIWIYMRVYVYVCMYVCVCMCVHFTNTNTHIKNIYKQIIYILYICACVDNLYIYIQKQICMYVYISIADL